MARTLKQLDATLAKLIARRDTLKDHLARDLQREICEAESQIDALLDERSILTEGKG